MNPLILIAETTAEAPAANGTVYFMWLVFFCLGFVIGLYYLKRGHRDVIELEEENNRLLAGYKKKERDFLDNQEMASAIIGKEFNNRK